MRTGFKLLSSLAVLALTLGASACDNARDVAGPDVAAPQFSPGSNGNGQSAGKGRQKSDWTVVEANLSGQDEAEIGASGGTLGVDGHVLIVRPGTLKGHGAYFSMKSMSGFAGFSLTAGSSYGGNDVGEAGFRRPVTLCIDYSGISTLSASARLGIAEYTADGGLELTESWDTGGQVCGLLRHFSDYVMVSD